MFLFDTALVALGAVLLARLVKAWIERDAANRRPALPPALNPAQVAAQHLADLRPRFIEHPNITYLRGAWRTSAEAVTEWSREKNGAHLQRVCGFDFSGDDLNVKLSVAVGAGGTGKTTLMKLWLAEVGNQQFGPNPIAKTGRIIVVDPTGLYRGVVDSFPADVSIFDLTLTSEFGHFWNVAGDVVTEADAVNFVKYLVEDPKNSSADAQFWAAKVRQCLKYLVITYETLGSAAWRVSDLIVALAFGKFLKPILLLNHQAKTFANGDLVDKLGQDIIASVTAVTDKFSAAAAYEQRATRGISMKDFLAHPRAVLYVGFKQPLVEPTGVLVSSMLNAFMTLALDRQVKPGEDQTFFVLDEGVYLKDLKFLLEIPNKGRGSGVGGLLSVISKPSLEDAFGESRAKALLANCRMVVSLACDDSTAKHVSELVGVTEAYVETKSVGVTVNTQYTYGRGGSSQGGNWSESWADGTSTSTTANVQLMSRPAVLPSELTGLPTPSNAAQTAPTVCGYAFTSDTGVFYFEFDIVAEYARLPPMPDAACPQRKEGPLLPFDATDLARLRVDPATPGIAAAMREHDRRDYA